MPNDPVRLLPIPVLVVDKRTDTSNNKQVPFHQMTSDMQTYLEDSQ